MFFEKLPGANKFISDFLNPKYPGMTGYPGYEVEEKEEKGTQLNFSKYDRFEEFQENPGYPYYIDYSDLASSDEGVVHQIHSPISNSESTNFFIEYYTSFSPSITQFYETRISISPIWGVAKWFYVFDLMSWHFWVYFDINLKLLSEKNTQKVKKQNIWDS